VRSQLKKFQARKKLLGAMFAVRTMVQLQQSLFHKVLHTVSKAPSVITTDSPVFKEKGSIIPLSSTDPKVAFTFRWDYKPNTPRNNGLELTAITINIHGKLKDIVNTVPNTHLTISSDKAIIASGSNDGGYKETHPFEDYINIDFSKLANDVTAIFLVLNTQDYRIDPSHFLFSNLTKLEGAIKFILNATTWLTKYRIVLDIASLAKATGVVVGKLEKTGNNWEFKLLADAIHGVKVAKDDRNRPRQNYAWDQCVIPPFISLYKSTILQGKKDFPTKITFENMRGENLVSKDTNGFSDPYLKFFLCSDIKDAKKRTAKTKVQKKTLNPIWKEVIEIELDENPASHQLIRIEVWDKDQLKKDDFMGQYEVNLRNYPNFTLLKDQSFELHGRKKKDHVSGCLIVSFTLH